jgi:CheY-like chemotaxis protein
MWMTEAKRTVFVMDDDLALQMVLELALREAGFEVVQANDGQEGLERLATLQPDAVISDVMMPNTDGVEVFQQIKERLQDEGIPIIIMTALSRKPWFADLEADGAVFLQKPFDTQYLIDLLNQMMMPLD